ncbi:MAG: hypothetical protein RLZZ142_105 [Verrucomicrobiota bacterium]
MEGSWGEPEKKILETVCREGVVVLLCVYPQFCHPQTKPRTPLLRKLERRSPFFGEWGVELIRRETRRGFEGAGGGC